MVKCSTLFSENFHRPTIQHVVCKFREIWLTEIGEIVCCLPDKKNLHGSPAVTTVQIAPNVCQGQPLTMYSECSRFHP